MRYDRSIDTAELSGDNADVIQGESLNLHVISAVRYIYKSVARLQELLNHFSPVAISSFLLFY